VSDVALFVIQSRFANLRHPIQTAAMRKFLLVFLLLLLGVAYFTKPDDKTCIIEGTKAVWGDVMPDVETHPGYFEQFMNVNSVNVKVKDWIFIKEIKYNLQGQQKTVAFGAFKTFFSIVRPMETKDYIPPMPPARR
jgi:hypothetical protein